MAGQSKPSSETVEKAFELFTAIRPKIQKKGSNRLARAAFRAVHEDRKKKRTSGKSSSKTLKQKQSVHGKDKGHAAGIKRIETPRKTVPNFVLHNVLVGYIPTLIPDISQRLLVINLQAVIKNLAREMWPDTDVEVFGSRKTDLALSSSNLDLAVIFRSIIIDEGPKLRRFCKFLKDQIIYLPGYPPQVITERRCARLPHISCWIAFSNEGPFIETSIYIAGGNDDYLQSTRAMQKLVQDKPPLRDLIIAVKQLCKVNGLLDDRVRGGSSYLIEKMATSYLDKAFEMTSAANLGDIFLGFLTHYGGEAGIQQTRRMLVHSQF